MSLRAYARRRGVSAMSVSLAVRDGRLRESVTRVGGQPKIADPDLADREWAANTDPVKRANAAGGDPAELVDPVLGTGASDAEVIGEGPNLQNAAARLKKWQADLAELKYKEAARELIPANQVERLLVDAFTSAKAHLLTLPSRAKQSLPHLSHSDLEALEGIVREALEALVIADAEPTQ